MRINEWLRIWSWYFAFIRIHSHIRIVFHSHI